MADTKLSWTELRRALAARAGVKEAEANAFLNALNAQIIEALKTDKQVKINGLGTFKLQSVAPRKSVNIKTGEEITIEGYNKIAFAPEAGVKELIESQKAGAENAVDPLKKLGAQAEEIVDILGELGQSPDEPKEKEAEVPVVEAPKAEAPKAEEPKEEPKKKFHFLRDTLICVVVLLLLLLIGYFFLRSQLSSWIENLTQKPAETEIVAEAPAEEVVLEPWTFDDILLTEKITAGSRLAWIAKKHYGEREYWPYIYAANKDKLSDPSKIVIGTPIRVPRLTKEQKDTTDVRYRQIKEEAYSKIGNWQ